MKECQARVGLGKGHWNVYRCRATDTVNGHGWTRLNVIDWQADDYSTEYPTATFRGAAMADRDRCGCHTQLCTRVATQEDLLCDQCRDHPDCEAT